MKYKEYDFFQEDLLTDSYDLESLGIHELGWKMPEILKVIEFVSQKNFTILGGDVYKINKNLLEITYDSWYIKNINDEDLISKSKERAINYINQYSKNNGSEFVYTIIFQKT